MQEQEETEAALQEAMSMSRQLSLKTNIERLKNQLPSEPLKGVKNVTKLKVRLGGSGAPIMRRFKKETSVSVVRSWVLVEMVSRDLNITNFRLNCNMPKCSYGEMDVEGKNELTLESSGLHPSAMLYVQDMDS